MARRSNSVADMLAAFNHTYNISRRVQQDRAISEVADAKPVESEGFTAEQGEQIAKAAQQDPMMGYDEARGGYVFTPQIPEGQTGPMQQQVIAKQGVTDFMGERYAGKMSADQVNAARDKAMATAIGRFDPAAGARMRREAAADARDNQRFAWESDRITRDARLAREQDEERAAVKALDADVGKWFQGRLKNEDGTSRPASVDDHLAASQYRASKLTQAGKVEQAGQVMKDFQAQAFTKIQLEGAQRDQALGQTAAALAAGDLSAVKDFYNRFVPDGSRVMDVKRGTNGQITIQRETLDGRKLPETVMKDVGQLTSALAAFKDPMAVYNYSQNEFKNTLALRADARADKALAIQSATAGATLAEHAQKRSDATAKAAAAVAVFKEANPNATAAQIEGVRTGVLQAVPTADKNAPSEVRLAHELVKAGVAKNVGDALKMAMTKKMSDPAEMHKEFVTAAMKGGDPAEAVAEADSVMQSMGYRKGAGGRWIAADADGTSAGGGQPAQGARYPDGTALRGKDGKNYVVKNGVPVAQ